MVYNDAMKERKEQTRVSAMDRALTYLGYRMPVSYTHLDVYKRQDEALAGLALAEARRMQKDGVETITLSFLSKEGESVGLPAYEAAFTPAPCRLLIRRPGVETAPAMEESPAPGDA